MSGEYSELLAEVKSAFADFRKEKSRQFKSEGSYSFEVLEDKVLHSISVYRKYEVDFYNSILVKMGTK